MNGISTKETFSLSYTGIRTRDTCLEGKDANRYTMYDNKDNFVELGHVADDKSLVMLFCCALVWQLPGCIVNRDYGICMLF